MVTGSFLWTSSSTCTTIGATGLRSTFLWSINSPFKVTLVLTSGSTCWQGSHIIYCHMNKCSHPCWNITCSDWYSTFQTLASSYTDFYPESTFSDSDFTTSDQNIFPTLFVQVLFLPVNSAVHVLFVYSKYAAHDTRERASFTGLFDNTWLVFNRPINRFSSKFKPPGRGQTAVTRIHFTACSKGQCEMWRFWNTVRYGADMYPYEPQPCGLWAPSSHMPALWCRLPRLANVC